MKKYLKRWNTLTERAQIEFFNYYMWTDNMCTGCVNPDTDDNCYPCKIMFPKILNFPFITHSNTERTKYSVGQNNTEKIIISPNRILYFWSPCPCSLYDRKVIKEHPPSVIEYCLIHDGWIEKED